LPVLIAFLAVGFGETVGQVLLIRELLVNFQGNELSLGVVLTCWLLMMALGSWGLGKFARRLPSHPSAFVFTIVLYCFILFSQLLLARTVNIVIGVRPGETTGLLSISSACLLVLTPLCLLHGFQFPLACQILAAQGGMPSVQIGRIYIAEALGSMAGGAFFTYVLVHYLSHLEIAALVILLNLGAGLFLTKPLLCRRFIVSKTLVLGLCLAGIIVLSSGLLAKLEFVSPQWQWQGHQLISSRNSVYQNIAVTQKEGQLNFFASGVLLFTAPVPDIKYVEEIAHFPLLYHSHPQKTLLLGGGMGGVLEEVVKHHPNEVFYVELDPLIIEIAEKYLPSTPSKYPGVTVVSTDGRLFVERSEAKFDVVIMNLPSPSTLQVNRFYTQEFFEKVQEILSHQGVFAFGLPSAEAYMSEEMLRLNRSVFRALKEVFPAVLVIPDDFSLFLASSDTTLLSQGEQEICQRLEQRGVETKLLNRAYIKHKLSLERISRLTAYLEIPEQINSDRRPISTFFNLALWNAMFHPEFKPVFDFALRIKLWWFLPPALLFFLPILTNLRRKEFPIFSVALSLVTTGFAGMTFSIALFFAFQLSYGYLYQKIGILTAAFMLGLALGCWGMNRVIGKVKRGVFVLGWIQAAVAIYAFSLPWLISGLARTWLIPGEVPFSFLNLVAGFLTGLEFPLANQIYLQRNKGVASVVGWLYAADLWGSVFGALFTAVLLVPVLGLISTCFATGILNLATFALLLTGWKLYPQIPGM